MGVLFHTAFHSQRNNFRVLIKEKNGSPLTRSTIPSINPVGNKRKLTAEETNYFENKSAKTRKLLSTLFQRSLAVPGLILFATDLVEEQKVLVDSNTNIERIQELAVIMQSLHEKQESDEQSLGDEHYFYCTACEKYAIQITYSVLASPFLH